MEAMAATAESPGSPRRLYRRPDVGLIGGVCAGIADALGVEVLYVRLGALVLTIFGGIGVAIYAVAWVLVPAAAGTESAEADLAGRAGAKRTAAGVALLVLAALLALRQAGFWLGDALVWPLVLGSSGLALILRQADATARRAPSDAAAVPPAPRRRYRAALGPVLVVAAALIFLQSVGALGAAGHAVGVILTFAVVVGLVFGPYLMRLARGLADERAQRIREQERAEVAAHLHDSVLQTLALIQKRADDPREVAGLARRQERELRRWLFERPRDRDGDRLEGALARAAAEVEVLHGVPIEVVVVGDAPMDEQLEAMARAAREAMANAARFAGVDRIDLYAEARDDRVEVFVRDRGIGFDPAAVPPDRRGVRNSIVARMRRHGGRATIHSAPGQGTEVELVVERGRP